MASCKVVMSFGQGVAALSSPRPTGLSHPGHIAMTNQNALTCQNNLLNKTRSQCPIQSLRQSAQSTILQYPKQRKAKRVLWTIPLAQHGVASCPPKRRLRPQRTRSFRRTAKSHQYPKAKKRNGSTRQRPSSSLPWPANNTTPMQRT